MLNNNEELWMITHLYKNITLSTLFLERLETSVRVRKGETDRVTETNGGLGWQRTAILTLNFFYALCHILTQVTTFSASRSRWPLRPFGCSPNLLTARPCIPRQQLQNWPLLLWASAYIITQWLRISVLTNMICFHSSIDCFVVAFPLSTFTQLHPV